MDKMLKNEKMASTLQKKPYVAPQMVVEYIEHQGCILCESCGEVLVEDE